PRRSRRRRRRKRKGQAVEATAALGAEVAAAPGEALEASGDGRPPLALPPAPEPVALLPATAASERALRPESSQ
ncbi:MAG: hypothetical protein C4305_03510, partial [Thermoleophilia bacterium]